ncbi:MAG TPA: TAXI family TRAP transporter solute-binding subunit [Xanthobacteraceae bacterium]|nr:TAXI family TRAP transporter solute-binding subunit [Xanthobacteraceae bacterium]
MLLFGWSTERSALAQPKSQRAAQQKKVNESALMILSGRPGTTYFTMARDIVAAVGEANDLRLMAVDGAGGADNIRDLLYLRGIDLALVPANLVAHPSTAAAFGPNVPQRLHYIARLYGEEIHVLVGRGIESIADLRGKKIAVPLQDGNAEFSVNDLLQNLQIEAEVVPMAAADAIDEVRSGTLAALVTMGGKPLRFVAGLPKDGSLRLLPLPYGEQLGDAYTPSAFRSTDYPALIAGGQTVETLSVGAVLVANNLAKSDEGYRRIAKFVPAFFSALSELAGPQWHPKWSEVNLAADLSSLPRFAASTEWLGRIRRQQAASMQQGFEKFLSSSGAPGPSALSPKQRRELFEEFVKWTRGSAGTSQQRP